MVDENLINLCYRSLDRVVCLCQQPQLNLKNSPPYILDTIPDLYEKLQSILTCYANNLETLNQIDYFQIFVKSLIDRCRITIRLFKDSKDKIFEPLSTARSRLVKSSLIFSHLLKDLNALFPENGFDLTNYRITKYDAAKWWSCHFQGQSIVAWSLFFQTLCQTFPTILARHALQLKQTIDLTCNDHVSIFEFDVFTRLFQPWTNIIETWEALTIYHPGYMSFMTYDEVKSILKRFRHKPGPGTYVFRISCTKPGQWAIGYITEDLRILQTIIQNKSLGQALLDGEREGFYLFPNGKPSPKQLLYHLVHNQNLMHLQVTQEQYQTYCEVGSTFELCKICDENNKDIQLEPCRHLICRNCFLNCQLTGNGQTCPFCRLEIKGIEEVVVDPYKPVVQSSTESALFGLPSSSVRTNSSANLAGDLPVSWYDQNSLSDTKSESVEHDLNRSSNRSLSLDMTIPCSHKPLSKDLIDLMSDCSIRKPAPPPPPIPPRHLSGSPRLWNSTTVQIVKESKCQSDFHMSVNDLEIVKNPDSQLGKPGNSISLECSSACLSDHLSKPDSDHCQCISCSHPSSELMLPPPPPVPVSASISDQSTSHQINSSSMHTAQSNSNSISKTSDLHYAQLDLIDSDPESDRIDLPDSTTNLLSSSNRSLDRNHRHHRHHNSATPSLSSSSDPNSISHNCHDPTTLDQTSHSAQTHHAQSDSHALRWDHYDHLTIDQTSCDLCHTGTTTTNQSISPSPTSSNPTSTIQNHPNLVEQNINHLIHLHPDMTRQNALLLLTLTENRFDMSNRIWEHFQPRTNCS